MKNAEKLKVLTIFAAVSASVLIISNIAAVKLWNFFGIPVDGGIIIFPLSYIVGDLIVELYGRKMANNIIYTSLGMNILAVLVFLLVGILPAYAGWDGQSSYEMILGFTPRIIAGSLAAYLVSGLINNFVFEKIKKKFGEKKIFVRFIGSSVVAKFFDSLIFETVAFLGVLSVPEFFAQAGFAYLASIILETLLAPISCAISKRLKKYEI